VEVTNREYPHVADEYIITYHENTTSDVAQVHWNVMATYGVQFLHRYNTGTHKGFAAKITDESVIEKLKYEPMVMAIEVNGIAEINQKTCAGVAIAPSWGLARISSNQVPNRGTEMVYYWDNAAYSGNDVDVYIIDTGILTTHDDFGGRAMWGIAFADGGSQVDGNGHGTHCAGTAVGTTFGVAKNARTVAVKVLGATGSGTWADVIAGVDWVASHGRPGKAVASMSLGGSGQNAGLTSSINNCVNNAGIPVVVAAGNSNANACSYTPSGIPSVISVGATEIAGADPDEFDNRASFSNFGTCVHIFAPGRDINSAWIGSNTATRVISGTSMACPHVAGQAACILSSGTGISPQAVKDQLVATAAKDVVSNPGTGSPNLLLYNECYRGPLIN
jgi:subtilisin family serine protease